MHSITQTANTVANFEELDISQGTSHGVSPSNKSARHDLNKPENVFLSRFSVNNNESGTLDTSSPIGISNSIGGMKEDSNRSNVVAIRDYFFQPQSASSELNTALNLLEESVTILTSAADELNQGNLVSSDDDVLHFQSLLPELFCCRKIGESFATVINALQNAFVSRKGIPLTGEQISATSNIIRKLLREPAMRYETAIDLIISFENVGFHVDLPGIDYLLETLESDGESEGIR